MAARSVHTPLPTAVSHWPSPGKASFPSPVLLTTNISGNAACCTVSRWVAAQRANVAANIKANPVTKRNNPCSFIVLPFLLHGACEASLSQVILWQFEDVLSQIWREVTREI